MKKMATITRSIYGNSWQVEERIGSTLYYTSHETKQDAIEYCEKQNYEYTINE